MPETDALIEVKSHTMMRSCRAALSDSTRWGIKASDVTDPSAVLTS